MLVSWSRSALAVEPVIMAIEPPKSCPLCRAAGVVRPFQEIERRVYWRCNRCEARFLDQRQLPGSAAEHAHYLKHDNHPDDPGYRQFLSRLARPLLDKLEPGRSGLDYGCGPGPALAAMLEEAGHRMRRYDPFFVADPAVFEATYDVITCTETAEHFHRPFDEFDRLDRLLRPGGWLGIMTCFQTDDARFASWHYRRDPTHVIFYREETMRHLADLFGWTCEIPEKDVALMRKPAPDRQDSLILPHYS
jgi:SAM-dependent methyltransferase